MERDLLVELKHEASVSQLLQVLEAEGARLEAIQVSDDADALHVTLTLDTPSEQLVSAFADLDFVTAVQWRK